MRKIFLLLGLMPLLSLAQRFTSNEVQRWKMQAGRVTIIREQYGVPHIYGKTDADVVFGLLYAQCEENFSQVEENHLEMLGRLSEVQGEQMIYSDLQMRLIYDSAAAKADYKRAPSWLKKLIDASTDGINYYLYKHPEVKPAVLQRFEPWFMLLRTDGSIAATQMGGATLRDLRMLYPIGNITSFVETPRPIYDYEPTGSNGFAVAPKKSATGNAMLYINPHTSFYFRSEVHLVSEEGLNAYGAVTWGTFFIYQGFNESCGWMHTSSYADVADIFRERVRQGNGGYQYQLDGSWRPVVTRPISVRYKTAGGLKELRFTRFATGHGPVVGKRDTSWLSIRELNRSMDALAQAWLRTKAKGFDEYRKIMNMRVNNSNNTVFADNKGHIAYWHGNFMPRRDARFDYSLPVDGSISATDWKGLHKVEETVHIYDPASGWIQNCNSTPFTAAGASSPLRQDYPAYMAPDGENYRGILASRLLNASGKLTAEDFIQKIGYNRYLAAFEVVLPGLLRAWEELPEGDSLRNQLREPILLLKTWNLVPSDTSVASALAIEWAYRLQSRASASANPYDASDVVRMVTSMNANASAREKLLYLLETMNMHQAWFGSWRTPWGVINRYQRPADGRYNDSLPSVAVPQAAATWGSLPSFSTRRPQGLHRRYGYHGNSFVACVEFGEKVKARSIITGGQSFDPSSPHFNDQVEGYINGRFKDVHFYRDDVLRNASKTYHPGE